MVRRNIKRRVHCERHPSFRRGASQSARPARRQGGKRVGWLRTVSFMSVGAGLCSAHSAAITWWFRAEQSPAPTKKRAPPQPMTPNKCANPQAGAS